MLRRLVLITVFWASLSGAAPLFEDDTVVDITLRGPVSTLFRDTEDRTERVFSLTVDGTAYPVGVRVRGNSRLRVCKFYPLRLNLEPDQYASTVFAGQDRLKLVTHCRNYDEGEQDLLEEYLAYRIFNVITDLSYRARLLRITYEDSDGGLDPDASPRYGFVIEPDWHLASRVGASSVELVGMPIKRYERDHAALVFVFQYLIGNTDWGFVKADYDDTCCHNGDLFEMDGQVYFIPYDFDIAGIVNARYAFPDPTLRITRVTRRLYRGLCIERDVLQRALKAIKSRQPEILEAIEEVSGLNDDSKRTALSYVGKFFDLARDEEKLLNKFEKRCL